MLKSFKYRIYPTDDQVIKLSNIFGQVRFVYNLGLETKISFQLPQGVYLSDDNKQIFLPKIKMVDIDLHREFKGTIKTVTVSKSVTNKYYVSILVDTHIPKSEKKPIINKTSVGVDLGIKDFAIVQHQSK